MKRSDIPKQGILQGVRVVVCAVSIAGPFAGELMAEMGAEVIQIESPKNPDYAHGGSDPGWMGDAMRRNMRMATLDVVKPKGREAFLKLMKETDIFIESSRGGQWAGWGLTDEVLWKANPKLVIAHISGFGQTGEKDYVSRASYDPIAQAFSGIAYANGDNTLPYFPIAPDVLDFYTAFYTSNSCLAGYINALKTGKGESFDIAQYECGLRTIHQYLLQDLVQDEPEIRSLWIAAELSGAFGNYKCKEGSVFLLTVGVPVCKTVCELLGFPYGSEEFPAGDYIYPLALPKGQKIDAAMKEFCLAHTADEVEDILNRHKVPCSKVITYRDMLTNRQYKARNSIITYPSTRWEDPKNPGNPITIKAPCIPAKAKNHPVEIWRSGVDFGFDTKDILAELGYSEEEIQKFFDKKVCVSRQDACRQYKHI